MNFRPITTSKIPAESQKISFHKTLESILGGLANTVIETRYNPIKPMTYPSMLFAFCMSVPSDEGQTVLREKGDDLLAG